METEAQQRNAEFDDLNKKYEQLRRELEEKTAENGELRRAVDRLKTAPPKPTANLATEIGDASERPGQLARLEVDGDANKLRPDNLSESVPSPLLKVPAPGPSSYRDNERKPPLGPKNLTSADVSRKEGERTEGRRGRPGMEHQNTLVSLLGTDDSQFQVNELLEDIKKLQEAKDQLQGMVEQLLKSEDASKLLLDKSQNTLGDDSPDNQKPVSSVKESPLNKKDSFIHETTINVDQLEQKIYDKLNLINQLQERIVVLEKENQELKAGLVAKPGTIEEKSSGSSKTPKSKGKVDLAAENKKIVELLPPAVQEQFKKMDEESKKKLVQTHASLRDDVDKTTRQEIIASEVKALSTLAEKDTQIAQLKSQLEAAVASQRSIASELIEARKASQHSADLQAKLEDLKLRYKEVQEENRNMIEALEEIRQQINDGRIIIKEDIPEENLPTMIPKGITAGQSPGKATGPKKTPEVERLSINSQKAKSSTKSTGQMKPGSKREARTSKSLKGKEFESISDQEASKSGRVPLKADRGDGSHESDIHELMKQTTAELVDLQERYNALQERASQEAAISVQIAVDNKTLRRELEEFKIRALQADNLDEIQQLQAIEAQMTDDNKAEDELIAENAELIEFMKKATGETNELKDRYTETIGYLDKAIKERLISEGSSDGFLEALDQEQEKAPQRTVEQLKQFNHGLWEAVLNQRRKMNNLAKRVQTVERWADDKELGRPDTERITEEHMDLPYDKIPATVKSVESQIATKKSIEPGNRRDSAQEEGTGTIPSASTDRQQRGEIQLSNEVLVDLLLSIVGLTEELRQVSYQEDINDAQKVKIIQTKLDNFEIIGEHGGLDMVNIQKMIQNSKDQESQPLFHETHEITEVSPEEEDDEDSKRDKSSKRQGSLTRLSKRADSGRRGLDSKGTNSEAREEERRMIEAEFMKQIEMKDAIIKELEAKNEVVQGIVEGLKAELEELRDKLSRVEDKSTDKKTAGPGKAKDDKELKKKDEEIKKRDEEVKSLKSEVEKVKKQLEDAQRKGTRDQSTGPAEKGKTKVAGEEAKTEEMARMEEKVKEGEAEIARLLEKVEKLASTKEVETGTKVQEAPKTVMKVTTTEDKAIRNALPPSQQKKFDEVIKIRDAEIARLREALATSKEEEKIRMVSGEPQMQPSQPDETLRVQNDELLAQLHKKEEEVAGLLERIEALESAKKVETTQKVQEAPKSTMKITTTEDKAIRNALPPSQQKKFDEVIKVRDTEIARLREALATSKEEEKTRMVSGEPQMQQSLPDETIKSQMEDLMAENQKKDEKIAGLLEKLEAVKSIKEVESKPKVQEAPKAAMKITTTEDKAIRNALPPSQQKKFDEVIKIRDTEIARLREALAAAKEEEKPTLVPVVPAEPQIQPTPADETLRVQNEDLLAELQQKDSEIARLLERIEKLESTKEVETVTKVQEAPKAVMKVITTEDKAIRNALPPSQQKKFDEVIKIRDTEIARLREALAASKEEEKARMVSGEPQMQPSQPDETIKGQIEELLAENQKKDEVIAGLLEKLEAVQATKVVESTQKVQEAPKSTMKITTTEDKAIRNALPPSQQKKFDEVIKARDGEIARLREALAAAKEEEKATLVSMAPGEPQIQSTPSHETLRAKMADILADNQKKDAEITALLEKVDALQTGETGKKKGGAGKGTAEKGSESKEWKKKVEELHGEVHKKEAEIIRLLQTQQPGMIVEPTPSLLEVDKLKTSPRQDELHGSSKELPLKDNENIAVEIAGLQKENERLRLAVEHAETEAEDLRDKLSRVEDKSTDKKTTGPGKTKDDKELKKKDEEIKKRDEEVKSLKSEVEKVKKQLEDAQRKGARDQSTGPAEKGKTKVAGEEAKTEEMARMEEKVKEGEAEIARLLEKVEKLASTKEVETMSRIQEAPKAVMKVTTTEDKAIRNALPPSQQKKFDEVIKVRDAEIARLREALAASKEEEKARMISGEPQIQPTPADETLRVQNDELLAQLHKKDEQVAGLLERIEALESAKKVETTQKVQEVPKSTMKITTTEDKAIRNALPPSQQKKFDEVIKVRDTEIARLREALAAAKEEEKPTLVPMVPAEPQIQPTPADETLRVQNEDLLAELQQKDSEIARLLERIEKLESTKEVETVTKVQEAPKTVMKVTTTEDKAIRNALPPSQQKKFDEVIKVRDTEIARLREALAASKEEEKARMVSGEPQMQPSQPDETIKGQIEELLAENQKKDEVIAGLLEKLEAVQATKVVESTQKGQEAPKAVMKISTTEDKAIRNALPPSQQKKFDEVIKARDGEIARLREALAAAKEEEKATLVSMAPGEPQILSTPSNETLRAKMADILADNQKKDAEITALLEKVEVLQTGETGKKKGGAGKGTAEKGSEGKEWKRKVEELHGEVHKKEAEIQRLMESRSQPQPSQNGLLEDVGIQPSFTSQPAPRLSGTSSTDLISNNPFENKPPLEVSDDMKAVLELFQSLTSERVEESHPLARARSIYSALQAASYQRNAENEALAADLKETRELLAAKPVAPERLTDKAPSGPSTLVRKPSEGEQVKEIEKKLVEAIGELEDKDREIHDLKKLIEIRDKTIDDLKKTLTIHVDKQVVKNTTRTESHEIEVKNEVVKLITENQKLRERVTIFERNFEQREKELLDEISRLASELSQVVSYETDSVPASVRKTVQNVKLASQIKNKDMVMSQMIEAMKHNRLKP